MGVERRRPPRRRGLLLRARDPASRGGPGSTPAAGPHPPAGALEGGAAAYACLYAWGTVRTRARGPAWRTASFMAGIVTVLLALQSGLDTYDDRLLSVHMVQHMLLLLLAPLLLLG